MLVDPFWMGLFDGSFELSTSTACLLLTGNASLTGTFVQNYIKTLARVLSLDILHHAKARYEYVHL